MLLLVRLSARLAVIPPPVRAVAWMLLATGLFSVMMALVRVATESMHPFQVAFLRNLFGFIFLLPWLARFGLGALRTSRLGLNMLRASIGVVSMLMWFTALSIMPLAQAVALSFTSPLFATVLAATVLHEGSGPRRLTAAGIGFLGTLVILRPGLTAISPAAFFALASACAFAVSVVLIKVIVRTDTPDTTVLFMTLFLVPLSLPTALWVWQWPDLQILALTAAVGSIASAGHLCFARALKLADASAILPLDFVRLPLTAIIAYFAFGEGVDAWTWIGAGIIVASAIYIARREALAARRARPKV